ncbi:MAG: valine--tRNA ligase, partial [Candidatus Eiseniibacteriota bacterium]
TVAAAESVMIAAWPVADEAHRDAAIEEQFARFQTVLAAVRDLRRRQNVAPRRPIRFGVRCDAALATQLEPLVAYFESLAWATPTGFGPAIEAPALCTTASLPGIEIFVDTAELIDVEEEIARNEGERDKLRTGIAGKQQKLANEKFVSRAPAAVVQRERDGLAVLEQQLASVEATLAKLRASR